MRPGLSPDLIERLLPDAKWTIADLEGKFPPRNLPDGAMVTRFAPSPTGYMHIGGLYQMLIDYKLAKQSGGVFILRIEDTDTKREVDGAISLIMGTQGEFGLIADESPAWNYDENKWEDNGKYGPYLQSQRKEFYHSVVAHLLATGQAYPCFLTADKMEEIRENQKSAGLPTGIYGEYARDRNLSEEEIISHLDNGEVPSIRLYSAGDKNKKIFCKDAVRGSIAFPENDEDIVLIKSNDGLPTYHFAHLVDDHFMRTTHVIRGEEWLPSFPLHVQMFNMMGWDAPIYVHTSTIDTIDAETGKQRKISKRKDPEANVDFFVKEGYPSEAVLDYLLNIISSGYEEERSKNQNLNWYDYPIKLKKIPSSGALFDKNKLDWWSKEDIARYSAEGIYNFIYTWNQNGIQSGKVEKIGNNAIAIMKGFQTPIVSCEYEDYLTKILSIERDPSSPGGCAVASNPKRIRKDFITWKQTLEEVSYFFDDQFPSCGGVAQSAGVVREPENKVSNHPAPVGGTPPQEGNLNRDVLSEFLKTFDINDDKDTWWNKIKDIAMNLGIGNGDAAMALRIALTGRTNTPDLYSIMQVMGDKRVRERIKNAI